MATTSSSTKAKMIAGATYLISRRGVHATSLREVVQRTGTPRGSLAHHFPGGKQQMLEEAIAFASDSVASPLEALLQDKGVADGLYAFVGWWRRVLESSGFEAGCPVLAIAIEPLTDDGAADGAERLRGLAHEAFDRWQAILFAALQREGVSVSRARRLSTLTVASIEGTVALCRAGRSSQPLDDVLSELDTLLKAAVAA